MYVHVLLTLAQDFGRGKLLIDVNVFISKAYEYQIA